MISHDFEIEISGDDEVSASYGYAGGTLSPVSPKPLKLSMDPLVLETALLLENWLNLWGRIRQSELALVGGVLRPETFKVLGEHLWKLILDNQIGTKLRSLINATVRQSLRVSINVAEASVVLRSLPWEFLCTRDFNDNQVFLAAETDMVLTRHVALGRGRTKIKPATERLGVLFVTALPVDDFSTVALQVRDFHTEVDKIAGVEALPIIEGFNEQAIQLAVTNTDTPCHVVHVVGLCRGEPGKPEVLLSTGRNMREEDWQGPKPLIDALTSGSGEGPRLVILHLCEYERGDANENFERLAPALIQGGIPAVLAFQYPMPARGESAPGVDFYNDLAKGLTIGEAVQGSRHRLFDLKQLNREFGTPVLYLQDDGELIPKSAPMPQTQPGATSPVRAEMARTPTSDPSAEDLRWKLLDSVDKGAYTREAAQKVREWLIDIRLLADVEDTYMKLRARYLKYQNDEDVRQIYADLTRVCRGADPLVRLG